jgi:signal transduction histidine kinase
MELEPEALDHALEDTLEQLCVDLRETGVTIDIGDDTALPSVMADGRGLRTMLFNLLQNAVTWSPPGGVVRVSAASRAGMIDIVITDAGPGVDPADIPRLLKPFEQGQCALTRKSNGAGLGLPIVEALSGAMGGRLEILSSKGEGLTARLSLPAA